MKRLYARLVLIIILLAATAVAQAAPDRRAVELRQVLIQLHTIARLMQTTAHPDDEDGGMATLQSRGKGASVLLLTLTRGEGGQNKIGSNLLDVLGVLRTLELLAADRYYGVEQRFTRVADFGYSKSADETFKKWQGHDTALADMVRVIRMFRPDVLVSRFQGNAQDGHGHHIAAGILTREAFRAAADPSRFPEQIQEGLAPWQPKKLYVGIGFRREGPYTLALEVSAKDPLLGTTYVDYAMQGLKHQLSQGAGSWQLPPGAVLARYRLVESVLPDVPAGTVEKDLFNGIDTSVVGLASRLGADEAKVPWLRPALVRLSDEIEKATTAAEQAPSAAAEPLLSALQAVGELFEKESKAREVLEASAIADLYANLRTKQEQLRRAAVLALGLEVEAVVDVPAAADPQSVFVAVPGQSFTLKLRLANHGQKEFEALRYIVRGIAQAKDPKIATQVLAAGAEVSITVPVSVPAEAAITRPYWHRDNPETDAICTLDQPQYATLPFVPPPLQVEIEYEMKASSGTLVGITSVPVEVPFRENGMERKMELAVAPALSVAVEPVTQVIPLSNTSGINLKVTVQKNVSALVRTQARLDLPKGWQSEPNSKIIEIPQGPGTATALFHVHSSHLEPGRSQIRAVVEYDGQSYQEGYTVVTRPDLGAALYYQPATVRLSAVDVKVRPDLKVGYIMGAGDEIPRVLRQVGIHVVDLSLQDLAGGDLSLFDTIILGIRAYDTRDDVRQYNSRLLDYVAAGGTLLVQYNSDLRVFNSGSYTPYPAEVGRDRVSVEQAPVEVLTPQDALFHFPNQISSNDFDGWVQERGLYFMNQWDPKFEPLLSSHDPGEEPLKGGLLRARYGKGQYLFTGYSFFRQLPAGVPGAIRLFVNLVSAGHTDSTNN